MRLATVGIVLWLSISASSSAAEPAAKKFPFESQFLEIAAKYPSFGRVDDESRWAPELCRLPNPSTARLSGSEDAASHGQKIYFLYAKHRNAYVDVAASEQKIGQAIVKESWTPREISADEKGAEFGVTRSKTGAGRQASPFRYQTYATKEGKRYEAHEQAGLFIMLKLNPETPDTDDGWVYGTVSADGKRVTSSGRVESCMKCHAEAPHGRLFGLSETE